MSEVVRKMPVPMVLPIVSSAPSQAVKPRTRVGPEAGGGALSAAKADGF